MERLDWESPGGTSAPEWAFQRLLVRPLATGAMKAIAVSLMGLEWDGERAVPAEGPCILAANHVSWLDPPMLSIAVHEACRRVPVCLAWEGNDHGWTGRVMRLYGAVTIGEGTVRRGDLERVFAQIDRGRVLAIWPEGEISRDGRLQPFLPGLAWIVRRRPCPVVPVTILGTRRAWPHDRAWLRPGKVLVRFHPAIFPASCDLKTKAGRARFLEKVRRSIASGLPAGKADLPGGADLPDWPF